MFRPIDPIDPGVWHKDAPHPDPRTIELHESIAVIAGLSKLGSAYLLPAAYGGPARLVIERTGERWPGGPRLRPLVFEGVVSMPRDEAGKVALGQFVRKALLDAQARDDLDMARHRLLMSLRRRGHAA